MKNRFRRDAPALTKRSGVDYTHCLKYMRIAGTRNVVRVQIFFNGGIITAEFAGDMLSSKSGGGKNCETSLFRLPGSK